VSGYTVALTLGLPRETIRRKINALMEMGLLRFVEAGYLVPADTHGNPVMVRETLQDSAAARAYFTLMARAGAVTPQDAATAAERPHLPRMISRAANAYCLAVLEELRRLFDGEMMVGLIFCAIANANARRPGGEADEALGPERPASPITALALAETVGLPRETARRHIKKLAQLGFCEGGRRGLIVPEPVLSRPAVHATFERTQAGTRRFLHQLALAGVMSPGPEARA
jgi:predicted ArsR family transcriptional regulator